MKFVHKIDDNLSIEAECDKVSELDISKGLNKSALFGLYKIEKEIRTFVGHFSFSPMPGCCGIVVSSGTYLYPEFRKSNISEPFRKLKTELAKRLGYTVMIATSQVDNPASIKNMHKSKYTIVNKFTNKRTGNLIAIGIKTL